MFGGRKKRSSSHELAKEIAIKAQILDNLKETVKVLQVENNHRDSSISLNESSARFCSVLEAIFIHGLKATFLGRISRWGGGEMSPRMPEPSFWTFALVYSHKQVINAVEKYSQISSEVGRSRAWLRLALNDGLLVSYLSAMIGDRTSLSVHYESYAFMRDSEKMDLVLQYVTGIEVFSFSLPTNVSMLNRWLPEPLVMAGVWKTNIQPMTDTGAVDAAELAEEVAMPTPQTFTRNLAQPAENNSLVQLGLLNEDEALKFILGSTPVSLPETPPVGTPVREMSPTPTRGLSPVPPSLRSASPTPARLSPTPSAVKAEGTVRLRNTAEVDDILKEGRLKRIVLERSPSPEPEQEEAAAAEHDVPSVYDVRDADNEPNDKPHDQRCTEDVQLLEESTKQEQTVSTDSQMSSTDGGPSTPSLEWDEFPASHSQKDNSAPHEEDLGPGLTLKEEMEAVSEGVTEEMEVESNDSSCTCSTEGPRPECSQCVLKQPDERVELSEFVEPDPGSTDLISQEEERSRRKHNNNIGFRTKPKISLEEFSLHRNLEMVSCLDIIPRELGLDSQDWRCIDCTKAIGVLFGNGKLCSFTKKYYCEDCHVDDMSVIPARLVYNWDAKLYPVSKSSLRFITLARTQPVINLPEFNPDLTDFVPVLETCNRYRKQLIYLSAYVSACSRAEALEVRQRALENLDGREHLVTKMEMFSVQDLVELEAGRLVETLKNVVKFCLGHVKSCLVCAGRGFICEICQDKRPVYPFNLDSTCQCEDCCTVFHAACAQTLLQCPRCERLAARSFNMLVAETKLTRELNE